MQIDISLLNYSYPYINQPQVTTLKSAVDIPQPYGTLNITILNSGCVPGVSPTNIRSSFDDHRLYLVVAHNAGTVVANTGAFDVKPPSENGGGGNSTMPSYVASHS